MGLDVRHGDEGEVAITVAIPKIEIFYLDFVSAGTIQKVDAVTDWHSAPCWEVREPLRYGLCKDGWRNLEFRRKKDTWEYELGPLVGFLPENHLVKRVGRELQAKTDKEGGIVRR
jgi:hypothetical protein